MKYRVLRKMMEGEEGVAEFRDLEDAFAFLEFKRIQATKDVFEFRYQDMPDRLIDDPNLFGYLQGLYQQAKEDSADLYRIEEIR